jgi:hypothetical protein
VADLSPPGVDVAPSGSRSRSTLLIPFVLFCAVIADRAQVSVATGGKGALPVLLLLIVPAVAVLVVATYGRERSLGFMGHPIFVLCVLPYLTLTLILPMLGIIFYSYPERTLLSTSGTLTAVSFLIIGAVLSTRGSADWTRWLVVAIVVQFAYALGQAIYLGKGPGWELFAPFHAWDLSLQGLNGFFVQARSSGLYFNPNELGLWAGIALVLAWAIVQGRLRYLAILLALLTLLLSQSRGVSVALLAALAAGVGLAMTERRISLASAAKTMGVVAVIVMIAGGAALIFGIPDAAVQRFNSLIAVVTQGAQADANLAGRLDYWSAVTNLNAIYPWGTFGPPELLLGTAVDSSWFETFAQGSIPYAATLGLLLLSTLGVTDYPYRHALRITAVLIAVAGITQTPFGYPASEMFWVLLGAGLQASAAARARIAMAARTATIVRSSGTVAAMDRPVTVPDRPITAMERPIG